MKDQQQIEIDLMITKGLNNILLFSCKFLSLNFGLSALIFYSDSKQLFIGFAPNRGYFTDCTINQNNKLTAGIKELLFSDLKLIM